VPERRPIPTLADRVITALHGRALLVREIYGFCRKDALDIDQIGSVVRALESRGYVEVAGLDCGQRRYTLSDEGRRAYREAAKWRKPEELRRDRERKRARAKPKCEACGGPRNEGAGRYCRQCYLDRARVKREVDAFVGKSEKNKAETSAQKIEEPEMPQPTQTKLAATKTATDVMPEPEQKRNLVPIFAARTAKEKLEKVRAELRKQLETARENYEIAAAVERDLAGVVNELERMLGDETSAA